MESEFEHFRPLYISIVLICHPIFPEDYKSSTEPGINSRDIFYKNHGLPHRNKLLSSESFLKNRIIVIQRIKFFLITVSVQLPSVSQESLF